MEGRSAVSEGESGVGLARCVLAWLYQQLHGKSFEHGEGAFSISPMHAAHHHCGGWGQAARHGVQMYMPSMRRDRAPQPSHLLSKYLQRHGALCEALQPLSSLPCTAFVGPM